MPHTKINGIDLYYEVHGEGPALVLAHGGGGNHLSWWQQVPELSRQFRCVTFDHRGFGDSRDVDGGPGAVAFVEDLRQLLDHLGLERAALAGQSMGGWTVLGFAAAYPERVNALVLCDTTAGLDDPEVIRAQATAFSELRKGGLTQILTHAYAADFPRRDPVRHFLYQQISGLNRHVPPTLLAHPDRPQASFGRGRRKAHPDNTAGRRRRRDRAAVSDGNDRATDSAGAFRQSARRGSLGLFRTPRGVQSNPARVPQGGRELGTNSRPSRRSAKPLPCRVRNRRAGSIRWADGPARIRPDRKSAS